MGGRRERKGKRAEAQTRGGPLTTKAPVVEIAPRPLPLESDRLVPALKEALARGRVSASRKLLDDLRRARLLTAVFVRSLDDERLDESIRALIASEAQRCPETLPSRVGSLWIPIVLEDHQAPQTSSDVVARRLYCELATTGGFPSLASKDMALWEPKLAHLAGVVETEVRAAVPQAAEHWTRGNVRFGFVGPLGHAIDGKDVSFELAAVIALLSSTFKIPLPPGAVAMACVDAEGSVRPFADRTILEKKCCGLVVALPIMDCVYVYRDDKKFVEDIFRRLLSVEQFSRLKVYGVRHVLDLLEGLGVDPVSAYCGVRRERIDLTPVRRWWVWLNTAGVGTIQEFASELDLDPNKGQRLLGRVAGELLGLGLCCYGLLLGNIYHARPSWLPWWLCLFGMSAGFVFVHKSMAYAIRAANLDLTIFGRLAIRELYDGRVSKEDAFGKGDKLYAHFLWMTASFQAWIFGLSITGMTWFLWFLYWRFLPPNAFDQMSLPFRISNPLVIAFSWWLIARWSDIRERVSWAYSRCKWDSRFTVGGPHPLLVFHYAAQALTSTRFSHAAFGAALTEARMRAGMTPLRLAEVVSSEPILVSGEAIDAAESGEEVSPLVLFKLANFLGKPLDRMLDSPLGHWVCTHGWMSESYEASKERWAENGNVSAKVILSGPGCSRFLDAFRRDRDLLTEAVDGALASGAIVGLLAVSPMISAEKIIRSLGFFFVGALPYLTHHAANFRIPRNLYRMTLVRHWTLLAIVIVVVASAICSATSHIGLNPIVALARRLLIGVDWVAELLHPRLPPWLLLAMTGFFAVVAAFAIVHKHYPRFAAIGGRIDRGGSSSERSE